jgi:hypothetical protein
LSLNKLFEDKNGNLRKDIHGVVGVGGGGETPLPDFPLLSVVGGEAFHIKGLQWIGPYASWTIKLKM